MRSLIITIGLLLGLSSGISAQDIMPEYPGGIPALMKFVQDNLVYPDSARIKGVQGKVTVKFMVDRTGQVGNVSVLQSPSPMLNEAAMDVVRKMPQWTPGSQGGKNVDVFFNLPINFNITDDRKK